ncbi:MAG TPA: GNAT family N-acetyltransferase [Candidatus Binataceae bacterium]|nr:GNAT family N-acetyltransferase [Candidatus Binataceae bacterium]
MKKLDRQGAGSDAVVIRAARPADLPSLIPLIRAYYRFDHIRFNPRTMKPALERLLCSPALGRVWIMLDGARAVGYVVLTFNYDLEFNGLEGIVTDLFIHANFRGGGLGRRALDFVDDYCRKRGIGTVELQVETANTAAQAFYQKIGFTRLDRVAMSRDVKHQPGRAPDSIDLKA